MLITNHLTACPRSGFSNRAVKSYQVRIADGDTSVEFFGQVENWLGSAGCYAHACG